MDKVTEALVAALKEALAQPGEHRLYRSGKLAGLFPGRTGANAEAAARALRDGLLEIVRTETKGKAEVEWVKPTPKGVNFVHDHESPVMVLRELRTALETARDGTPAWLAKVGTELQELSCRLTAEVQKYLQRLEALGQRVDEALRRAEAGGPAVPDGVAAAAPWAVDVLAYLDRRQTSGANGHCPLPELFAALREQHAELSLPDFHDGLRRLQDRRALRLFPAADPSQPLAEPEYALLDGVQLLYFAAR